MSEKSMGRGLALYSLASLLVIGLAAAVFVAVYSAPADRRTVVVSALVALVVQLVAFAFARMMADRGNAIAGWVLGAVVCFTALIVYGFVCRSLGLPPTAALLSLATFFFLTELIEPPFLTI
jgi:heme/copper-type cytochrome/quinol oxidase subunit 4